MILYQKNVFAVEYKENGKVIGSLGLHDSWANRELEFKEVKVKEKMWMETKRNDIGYNCKS